MALLAGYAVPQAWLVADGYQRFLGPLLDWVNRTLGEAAGDVAFGLGLGAIGMYGAALLAATFAVPLGLVARAFARRRLRAQDVDAFAKVRAHLDSKPRTLRRLSAGAAVGVAALAPFVVGDHLGRWTPSFAIGFAAALMLAGAGVAALARSLVRRVVAPFDAAERGPVGADADGMFFSAVAVTREARAVVAVFALASLAMLAFLIAAPLNPTELAAPVAAYVTAASAAALAFRRMSRIALGVDGLLVSGTSRTRFYAYKDLDEVSVSAFGDVVLKKDERVVLRLQIHGDDAPRTTAIVSRIQASISHAAAAADDGAQRLAERSPAVLAQAARGDGNYRSPGATRDALWEIVESGASNASARAAAARALAQKPSARDRQRLRIAAEQCVDPSARAELLRIAPAAANEAEGEARRGRAER